MPGTEMFGVIALKKKRARDVIKSLIEEFSGEEVWKYLSFEGTSARFYGGAPDFMWEVLPRLLEELRQRRLLRYTYVFIVDEEGRKECKLYEGGEAEIVQTDTRF